LGFFFIHMRRNLLKKTSTWEEKNTLLWPLIQDFDISFIYWQKSISFICRFDISQWSGNQSHFRVFHICFVFRCIIEIVYWRQNNDSTLWQMGLLQFLHRQLLTYVAIFHLHLHMVYISQLIRYAKACSTYDQILIRSSLLTDRLKSHGFLQSHLQTGFRIFYGCYNNLVCSYNLPLGHMLSDMFHANR
jgi:hypothetical protein